MKIITKETVALIQLKSALEHFNKKEFIVAITLAAAAEEILGKLSKLVTKTNSLELESVLFRFTFPKYNYQIDRNKIRNELKHLSDGKEDLEYGNFKQTAIIHISGAITNYKLMNGFIPKDEIFVAYCNEIGLSLKSICLNIYY
jgi:hypothetical protein